MLKFVALVLVVSAMVQINDGQTIGPPSCRNLIEGPYCQNLKDLTIRLFGKDGAHCNIPGKPHISGPFQSYCQKDCCQCQGKLRCKYFIDNLYQTAYESRSDGEFRHENVISFESPLEKMFKEALESKKNPEAEMLHFQASTKDLWKQSHH